VKRGSGGGGGAYEHTRKEMREMEVNEYISCHVHVKAARSGRTALELLAVRKGWGIDRQ
jgi:hypothetical protein